MNISDYLRTALLNHSLGVAEFVMPSKIWAGLYTTPPTSAGGGIEVPAADYARVSTTWAPAAVGVIQNSLPIRFPVNGETLSNWGTSVDLGLFDSSINGNLLYFGGLSAAVTLSLGTDFSISIAGLKITFS